MTTDITPLSTCGCCETGVEEPSHENRPGQSALNYRIGTHSSFLRRMLSELAREEIASGDNAGERPLARLTTRATDDASIAMLDAWATIADVLAFYQERIANEGFLRTATERNSILELARTIGYELNPGVAASTHLAFTLDDSPSAPDSATISAGTQVQSIPAKEGELPQTFETSEEFEAWVKWNALRPVQTTDHEIKAGITSLYLKGVSLRLAPGDAILIVGFEQENGTEGENWAMRPLKTVDEFPQDNYTLVTWEENLAWSSFPGSVLPGTDAEGQVHVFRQRTSLFGYNAPDWRVMSLDVKKAYVPDLDEEAPATWGDEWPSFELGQGTDPALPEIDLDAIYPKILEQSWLVLQQPDHVELYRVEQVAKAARSYYAIAAKTTRVTLDGENLESFAAHRRDTVVYGQPEELERAERPLDTKVKDNTIELDQPVTGLQKGQPLIVCGKLDEADEDLASEVAFFDPLLEEEAYSTLRLSDSLENEYVRSTATIFANVVPATHGETVADEVLGSGDGAQPNQRFTLKRSPLTLVSAATAAGSESSLEVRVNEVLWEQVASLYGKGPADEVYIVRIDNDAKAAVVFGDGEQGARLSTGQENVKAAYRFGIGSEGQVGAGALSLLKKRPFGVRSVANPVAAGGAADPEKLEDARTNAPLTVLTLDRIVSLQDFEDFARAFTGIGKAQAASLWDGESNIVHITVAGENGDTVPDNGPDSLMAKLKEAIDDARDPSATVLIGNYEQLTFHLEATIFYDSAYLMENVQAAIEDELLDAFSFDQRGFGQPVTAAEIISAIHQVEGVVAVDLDAIYAKTAMGASVVALRPNNPSPHMIGFLASGGIGLPGFLLSERLPLAAAGKGPQAVVLAAKTARRENADILPAQLLLLDEAGIHLTMKAA